MKLNRIKIKGYYGTWYVVDSCIYPDPEFFPGKGKRYYCLEHESYGDETYNLLIDSDYNVLSDDSFGSAYDLCVDYFG